MTRRLIILLLLAPTVAALAALPRGRTPRLADTDDLLVATGHAAARLDTVYLLGGPDRQDGKFQGDVNPALPDAEGWIGVDLTTSEVSHWRDSDFNSPTGTQAAWCGGYFLPCSDTDSPEGYPNHLKENLVWYGEVQDPSQSTDVTVTLSLNWDTEPNWDYLFLQFWQASSGAWYTVESWTGVGTEIGSSHAFVVAPENLSDGRVRWRLRAYSDQIYSDVDCNWPTTAGLCQVDDVSVTGTNGLPATYDDFETGIDGCSFVREYDQGVGNFAQVWPYLATLDPCDANRTPRFAFIDDGIVEPCTGGTLGYWDYGPGGYAVNMTGGCLGPTAHISNQIWSPPIAWESPGGQSLDPTYASALLEYDVYTHNILPNMIFYDWHVRSSSDSGQSWTGWRSDGTVYYSNIPTTRRERQRLDSFLVPGVTSVQIALGVFEIGWIWGSADQPSPAPYFDNVALVAFPTVGPAITADAGDLAQDAFPAIGTLDYADLGRNDVRIDMARDIAPDGAPGIVPGDSIVVTVDPLGLGSELVGPPVLHYAVKPNPLFDAYRAHPVTGSVEGDTVFTSFGEPIVNRFSFDLPDEDFLYPGDVMHYYISAEQDGPFPGTATLPASLAGFGVFRGQPGWQPGLWPELFALNALPTMYTDAPGDQAAWLFWQDGGPENAVGEWLYTLGVNSHSLDWDTYTTNSPSSGSELGLGGRATPEQIAGYDVIFYDAGDRATDTLLPPGEAPHGRDDLGLLDAWLAAGGRMILCGDGVVSDLIANGGAAGAAFVADRLGVSLAAEDIQDVLPGPRNPLLVPDPAGFDYAMIGMNACPGLRRFDAVVADAGATRLYHWREVGLSDYAALTYFENAGSRVFYLPLGLGALWTAEPVPPGIGPIAARTYMVADMLLEFGIIPGGGWTAVGDVPGAFSTAVSPNPFNPKTTLTFTAPHNARAVLEIFDVRGAKVRTLLDARVPAGPHHAEWDGRDDRGEAQASGVYFARVRVGEEQQVEKLALIR